MTVRGQALVEALVAALALTPLMFAIVQLAAIQSAEQATLAAARSAALASHHGLDGPGGPLSPLRVRELYFPGPGSTAGTGSEVVAGSAPQPASAEQAEDVALALIAPAVLVGVGDPDLPRSRAVVARATTDISAPYGVFPAEESALRVAGQMSLMRGDWDAAGAERVWRRAAALSTTGRIAAWRGPLSTLAAPMQLLEPAVGRLCFGRIDPDIVPEDRLQGLARAPDLRTQPC